MQRCEMYREAIKLVESDGWYLRVVTRGSHRQFKHVAESQVSVTISGHPNVDIPRVL